MICPYCRNEISLDSNFCIYCGSQLKEFDDEEQDLEEFETTEENDEYLFVDDDFDEDFTDDYGEYDDSFDDYQDEGWGDGTDCDYDY